MSEYMERFSVSRLIGAPPGYVGYDEGGTLTEAVRTRPYRVILLDEFEKAHKDVSNLLLQVFDEGRLSDSKGRTVDFRNTVIIMTSNLLQEETLLTDSDSDPSEAIRSRVSEHFAPEFVNRLDEVVLFKSLSQPVLANIAQIQLNKVIELLRTQHIHASFSDALKQWIVENGYSSRYGARPLKRLIQSKILDPFSTILLEVRSYLYILI